MAPVVLVLFRTFLFNILHFHITWCQNYFIENGQHHGAFRVKQSRKEDSK